MSAASSGGSLVLVSHDEALLQGACDRITEVRGKRLHHYVGNYSTFLSQREERAALAAATAASKAAEIARLEEFVTRFGAKASKASEAQSKLKVGLQKWNGPAGGGGSPVCCYSRQHSSCGCRAWGAGENRWSQGVQSFEAYSKEMTATSAARLSTLDFFKPAPDHSLPTAAAALRCCACVLLQLLEKLRKEAAAVADPGVTAAASSSGPGDARKVHLKLPTPPPCYSDVLMVNNLAVGWGSPPAGTCTGLLDMCVCEAGGGGG
jgi:hypothetical protein